MSTLARLQSFWQQRRRQILIGVAVAGAGVAVGTLIYYGLSRRVDDSEYDDNKKKGVSDRDGIHDGSLLPQDPGDGMTDESQENQDDQQLQLHFSKIQTIADTTTLPAVLPHLKARLLSLLDTAPITAALSAAAASSSSKATSQSPQSNPATSAAGGATSAVPTAQEKLRLWEELCLVSFCRSLAAVTSVALLGLFVRTQLNVLGRRVFLEAASGGEEENVMWWDPCAVEAKRRGRLGY